jgi:hypothetical protein
MVLDFLKKIFNSSSGYTLKNSDVFIVSYPKSGNSWVRFLIANYISEKTIDFNTVQSLIPDIESAPDKINNIKHTPRFIKSHSAYNAKYPNVIYIVRDGRDTAVSYYYYHILIGRIDKNMDFRTYFYDFFMKEKSKFGGWGEHVNSWRSASNVLFIKYEDMLSDTENEFKKILKFSGLELNPEKINRALHNASFKNLQQIESMNRDYMQQKHNVQDSGYGFVRKGILGDWKNHFDDEMLAVFNSKYSTTMYEIGYK